MCDVLGERECVLMDTTTSATMVKFDLWMLPIYSCIYTRACRAFSSLNCLMLLL